MYIDTRLDQGFLEIAVGYVVADMEEDGVEIGIAGVSSFEGLLTHATQNGRDVEFRFSETDTLTLERTHLSDLDEDAFVFV